MLILLLDKLLRGGGVGQGNAMTQTNLLKNTLLDIFSEFVV